MNHDLQVGFDRHDIGPTPPIPVSGFVTRRGPTTDAVPAGGAEVAQAPARRVAS